MAKGRGGRGMTLIFKIPRGSRKTGRSGKRGSIRRSKARRY